MKLYDYLALMGEGIELTVWDRDYDTESYFYGGTKAEDSWEKSMIELSKLLTVEAIHPNGVTVNLSEVIENHIKYLEKSELFIECDIDLIMEDIEAIISGNVSEDWMETFINVLKI